MAQAKSATFLVVWLFTFSVFAQSVPTAEKGILDITDYNFASLKPLKLNGEWEFYWNELAGVTTSAENLSYVAFPHHWTGKNAQGFATYRLKVFVDSKAYPVLAVQLPQIYCAYSLLVNGAEIAKNGVVGTSRKDTRAQWLPQTVSFTTASDTLDIALQIANFHHSIGGIKNPIYLGESQNLLAEQHTSYLVNTALLGVLVFIGLCHWFGVW